MDLVLLTLAAMGLAKLVRALPMASAIQFWLEQTWTKGKPLNCWFCLVFWSALGLVGLLPGHPDLFHDALLVLAATGAGSTILGYAEPLGPTLTLPPEL